MEGTHVTLQQAALVVPLRFRISAGAPAFVRRSGCPLSLANAHSRTGGYSCAGGAYARAVRTVALHTELRPGCAAFRRADRRRSGCRGSPPGSAKPGNRRRFQPLPQRAGLRGRCVAERLAASFRTTADPLYHDSRGAARGRRADSLLAEHLVPVQKQILDWSGKLQAWNGERLQHADRARAGQLANLQGSAARVLGIGFASGLLLVLGSMAYIEIGRAHV